MDMYPAPPPLMKYESTDPEHFFKSDYVSWLHDANKLWHNTMYERTKLAVKAQDLKLERAQEKLRLYILNGTNERRLAYSRRALAWRKVRFHRQQKRLLYFKKWSDWYNQNLGKVPMLRHSG